MTWISYAQNGEDVMLRRALADVAHGFYVDVFPFPNEPGALPQTSVTQAEAVAACASAARSPRRAGSAS